MNDLSPYHSWLCRQRAACEGDLCCMQAPKVVRNVDGQDRVFCYEHDPEHIHDFSAWLDATSDAIEDAERKL